MPEYRVLERVECDGIRGERVHLAKLDTSRSLCGSVTFDGSPFDAWQTMGEERGPEDVDGAETCTTCWESWEIAKRAERESRGQWNAPERTHKRRARRYVAPHVASQRIANATPAPVSEVPDYFRMFKRDLQALGTPEAVAELERRAAKRARKRSERVAA